ncbi:uncharacterized protein LOC118749877 [Rhagoletis pomonella]|uniref:uncharacterized protein LOC118749877 n=1 Tax=Rhagoletis pomonella TaxID=28610 RepID=UPI0017827CDA|nr:uncharacterized protein LOC118749877 [Rhagoletis pomonella]
MNTRRSGRMATACDEIAFSMTIDMAEIIKSDYFMANSIKHDHCNTEPTVTKLDTANSGHGTRIVGGLRRQPTKYPHRLNTSIRTVSNEPHKTSTATSSIDQNSRCRYSRSSTLRSSSDGNIDSKHHTKSNGNNHNSHTSSGRDTVPDDSRRKYRVNMITRPVNFSDMQMRRHKYPLTGNYYLDIQDAMIRKHPPVLRTYLNRFRWKSLRCAIIFLVSTLLLFSLILYCICLHDVSVAQERYQRQQQELSKEAQIENNDAQFTSFAANSVNVLQKTLSIATTTIKSTTFGNVIFTVDKEREHLQKSTILRAINTHENEFSKEQKLRTFEFAEASKNVFATDKESHTDRARDKDEPIFETTTYASADTALVPTNVLHHGGFNGHQNRLFNNVFSPDQRFVSTTKSLAKVSPTVPPLAQFKPTHAISSGFRSTPQDNGCYSTSLPMCQGVLDYDLTYNSTITLQFNDEKAFQKLVESNCSTRALEFICVTLEPECRPSHIGILPPCQKICKAVLEACSIVISEWDPLNELFDCSLYPDSNDPNKCEDPTRRRGYCYDNEFTCYDRSCIPHQWQCDNIKDCAAGEDEDRCLVCDYRDEFRCRSNEKCVAEPVRCDLKYDCLDGSDEEECDDYGSAGEDITSFDEAALNLFPRMFSYASFPSSNQTHEGLYIYITYPTDDENSTKFQVRENANRTRGISPEEVANSVSGDGPKGFVNFPDSKEIMMTSDTENKFKYSSDTATSRPATCDHSTATSKLKVPFSATTPLKPAHSMRVTVTTEPGSLFKVDNGNGQRAPTKACAPHQLRCVSGECITVNELCDKKIDCPDGADELMCVYKELRSSTTPIKIRSSTGRTSRSRSVHTQSAVISTAVRADKRSLTRTTIKKI